LNACLHTLFVPFIIATDLQDIVVFTLAQTGDSGAGTYEMVKISQMVTYLVCDGLKYRFKVFISRVRQVTKDVVKSEV